MGTRSHCEAAVEIHIQRMLINMGVHPDEHGEEIHKAVLACVESTFDPAWAWGKECANEELEMSLDQERNSNTAARAVVISLISEMSDEQMPQKVGIAVEQWRQSYITGSNMMHDADYPSGEMINDIIRQA